MEEPVPCLWHYLTTVIDAVVILRFHTDDTGMSVQEQLSLTMSALTKLNANLKTCKSFRISIITDEFPLF